MRIDTNNMAGIGASGLDRTQSADAVEQQAGQAVAKRGAGGATDQVNLSVLAERLQSMEPQSPERQARLEQLSAAYQAGTYNPDPMAVSEAMIDDATSSSGDASGRVGPG
ncbi:flagellar biosynthesis anti-sigma factor FlgM [Paludibaculum fermentans]|uniref:Flagellar biosynthesis anti-sigma factor FlgM n=1 Tax=Paludibaculum fermentans TaxID=1473598 RepID=A0A7S7NN92_PALFE|nr:flagellar biosynthesis anti-sigma factor FlgM [Paludibaculum fermentans]QOY86748.1 flagellar biosynthesis anti-sigma factor FlgM [Paludibaculum fermentans]